MHLLVHGIRGLAKGLMGLESSKGLDGALNQASKVLQQAL